MPLRRLVPNFPGMFASTSFCGEGNPPSGIVANYVPHLNATVVPTDPPTPKRTIVGGAQSWRRYSTLSKLHTIYHSHIRPGMDSKLPACSASSSCITYALSFQVGHLWKYVALSKGLLSVQADFQEAAPPAEAGPTPPPLAVA